MLRFPETRVTVSITGAFGRFVEPLGARRRGPLVSGPRTSLYSRQKQLVHLGGAPKALGVPRAPGSPGPGPLRLPSMPRLLDWPTDVAALADALDVERFAVFAGGPHAAVCAYALPERVTVLGLVSAASPAFDLPEVALAMP